MFDTILFDCDGVIVDSEKGLSMIAADVLRSTFGIPAIASDFQEFIGMGEDGYIGGVVRKHGGVYTIDMKEEIYRQYIQILLEKGHAYYAFDTESELELRREEAKSGEKGAFQYDFKSRNLMQNALTLSGAEVNSRIQSGQPYVIRIKIPENEVVSLNDLIRGEVTVNTANLDDIAEGNGFIVEGAFQHIKLRNKFFP
ncbi:hypothetical protein EOM86_07025 [Candidatus Nomurabacteria bacterium]|nr:hypothetical protein [Candidatus Nomurabacteria bacterium]